MHVKSFIALFLLIAMVSLIAPIPSINIANAQGIDYKKVVLPTTLTEPIEVDGEGGVVELTGSTNIDYFGNTDVIRIYNASKVIVSVSLYGEAVGTIDEFHVLRITANEIVVNSLSTNMKVIVFGTNWYDTRVFEFYASNKITIGAINLRLTVLSPDEITVLEMYSGSGGVIADRKNTMLAYDIDNFNSIPTDTIGTINMVVTAKHIATGEIYDALSVEGLLYRSLNNIKINNVRIDITAYASKAYYVYILGTEISSLYDVAINSVRIPKLLIYGGEYLEEIDLGGFIIWRPYWIRGITAVSNSIEPYENEGEEYTANIGTVYIGTVGVGNERAVKTLDYTYVVVLGNYYINTYIKRIIIRGVNVPELFLEYSRSANYHYICGVENYHGKLKYDILLMLGIESGMPVYAEGSMVSRSGKKLISLSEIGVPINFTGTLFVAMKDNGFIDVYDPELGDYVTYSLSRGDRVKIVFSKTTVSDPYTMLTLTRFGIGAHQLPVYELYINGKLIASNTIVDLSLGKASVSGSIKVYNTDTGELIETIQPLSTVVSGLFSLIIAA